MKKIVGVVCLVLLASLIAVGGMTLAFCMADDPALFHAVTSAAAGSVRGAAGAVGDAVGGALAAAGDRVASAAGAVGSFFTRTAVLEAHPRARVQPLAGQAAPATAFVTEHGRELLTGGTPLVYFGQDDPRWAQESYGGDPIGVYGCGPVTIAMVVSTLTGTDVDPAEMAQWCADNGYHADGSGSYLSIVSGTAAAFGLECTSLDPGDTASLFSALDAGGIAVAHMGPGSITDSGRFLILHGRTADGCLLAADPLSRENSLVPWDAQTLLSELSDRRSSGAPLWLIRAPK